MLRALAVMGLIGALRGGWAAQTSPSLAEGDADSLYASSDSVRFHLAPSIIEASRWTEYETGSLLPLTVIGPERLRSSIDFGIGELLGQSAGVLVRKSGGPGSSELLTIRGSTAQQVLVLLNGHRLNTAQGGGVDMSQFDPGHVSRLEVYREGNDPRYSGASMGGVVNVVTSREAGRGLGVRTTMGSYGAKSMSLTGGGGTRARFWASASLRQSDNSFDFEDPRRGETQRRVNAGVKSSIISSSLEAGMGEHRTLSFFVSASKEERGAPGPIEFPTPLASLGDERLFVQASMSDTSLLDFALGGSFHGQRRRYENPDPVLWADDRHSNTGISLTLDVERRLSRAARLRAGTSVDRDLLSSTTDGERERTSLAGYAAAELSFPGPANDAGARMVVSPGARFEKIGAYSGRMLPSIASKVSLANGRLLLRTSVGRKYRPPSFDELFWPLSSGAEGNPDLVPERSTSAEVSGTLYFREKSLRLTGTGFTRWLENLIEWTPGAKGIWRPHNVGRAREQGVELEAAFSGRPAAFLPPLALEVSHSLLSATDEGEDPATRGRSLVRRPANTSTLRLEVFPCERLSVGLTWNRVGRRYLTATNTKWLEAHSVLDLETRLTLWRGASLLLSGRNLGGESYFDVEDFPVPGRTFMAGLDFSFGK